MCERQAKGSCMLSITFDYPLNDTGDYTKNTCLVQGTWSKPNSKPITVENKGHFAQT